MKFAIFGNTYQPKKVFACTQTVRASQEAGSGNLYVPGVLPVPDGRFKNGSACRRPARRQRLHSRYGYQHRR